MTIWSTIFLLGCSQTPQEKRAAQLEMCRSAITSSFSASDYRKAVEERHLYEIAKQDAYYCVESATVTVAEKATVEQAVAFAFRECKQKIEEYDKAEAFSVNAYPSEYKLLDANAAVMQNRDFLARRARLLAKSMKSDKCWEVL